MSSTQLRPDRTRPLVAVVCAVPLLGEAVRSATEFADVQTFAERGGDFDGLLRWLRPVALIVDRRAGAEQAAASARENDLPVVHLAVREREVRFYQRRSWTRIANNGDGPTPEAIRNVVARAIFAKEVGEG